ncbi:MAG: cell division regulator GpsB [Bacilli bacterium]|nr:cell division regulator GpsB [Bacilli bacterium]
MNNTKILLTAEDILEKQFKVDARGYRPQEVDKFLDMIIHDYTEFINLIKKQNKEIKELTKNNASLKDELRKLNNILEAADSKEVNNSRTVNNVDLLKRISQLEKVVFGKNE